MCHVIFPGKKNPQLKQNGDCMDNEKGGSNVIILKGDQLYIAAFNTMQNRQTQLHSIQFKTHRPTYRYWHVLRLTCWKRPS